MFKKRDFRFSNIVINIIDHFEKKKILRKKEFFKILKDNNLKIPKVKK